MLASTKYALLHRIAVEQSGRRVPSIVAGLCSAGRLSFTGARGAVDGEPPTAGTQYRIGSITKSFIAVLIMRLRDDGKLALDDRLGKYLPDTRFGDATIAQLLSHTAGVTAEPPGPWWERTAGGDFSALQGGLADERFRHRPGARFHYSNVGFALLGELVARLRGADWVKVLRREILAPLGMRRTTPSPEPPHARGWAVHPYADVLLPEPLSETGAMAPAGQLWSTVTDLASWARFLGGDTGDVLSVDTLAEMRHPSAVDDVNSMGAGYGLGLMLHRVDQPTVGHGVEDRILFGHNGTMPGFLASLVVDPITGTAAVTLANCTAGPSMPQLADDLITIADRLEPPLPTPWWPADIDGDIDSALLELTGTWHWGTSPFTLRLLGGARTG
ncbi:MAG: beta-lactamase family protein, partial [Sciscionella sp.]|nr:beta-lactamase family protein [Sciscionella sp.]